VVPERFGVVDLAAVELGTEPAVVGAHGLVVAQREIGGAAALDVVGQEQLGILDRVAVGLRTEPPVDLAERLGQLDASTKVHAWRPSAVTHVTDLKLYAKR